ncbi:MAG: DUF5320 domain-containing protein [Gemmatimonadota bacterium]
MPRGDGAGLWGQGPMTGRSLGYCAGYEQPGYAAPGPGHGWARGGGGGYGRGRDWGRDGGRGMRWGAPWACWPPVPTPVTEVDEKGVLERQREYLQSQLSRIEDQLKSLSAGGPAQ